MKTYACSIAILFASGAASWGQTLSIGVKGGVPLLDAALGHDESPAYIVGPSVEVRLPAGFAIEADALYRRIGGSFNYASILTGANLLAPGVSTIQGPYISSYSNRLRANAWEFPILGKYYFRPQVLKFQPFLAAGIAFRTIGLHSDVAETVVDAAGTPQSSLFHNNSRSDLGVGVVGSAGVRFHAGRFALSPEFRYTRWDGADSPIRRNEAGLLLGISF